MQGLSGLFLALRRRPVIRYQRKSEAARRLAESLYSLTYKQQVRWPRSSAYCRLCHDTSQLPSAASCCRERLRLQRRESSCLSLILHYTCPAMCTPRSLCLTLAATAPAPWCCCSTAATIP